MVPKAVHVSETLLFFRQRECEAKKGKVLLIIGTFTREKDRVWFMRGENNFLHETEGNSTQVDFLLADLCHATPIYMSMVLTP